ncbi:MAG: glycosyltransferase [Cytophagales bacterium]|nr:glycosyltransferase [Cytophagales bacterium]
MALHRILLFDTITDGHHPDYLIHLIGFYSGNQEVELFVATGESFKSQFDARQKDENNQWGDNVTFLGIPTDQLNSIHSKPIYLRSIIEWNMLVETAKEIKASHVLLMYFDYYQLGILIGKKAPFAVSAIYFRPNFSENDQGIYPQIKKWMLSKVLKSGQIQNLFCLVHALVPYMKEQKTQTQIIPICDPVKQFEVSNPEISEFRNKFKIPTDKKIFLNFGYLDDRKGMEVFIDACATLTKDELAKICLLLAGPVPEYYEKIIEAKLAQVPELEVIRCYGYLPALEVQICFEISDVVLILYQDFLNMSSVLIRAAMANKPTFATRTGMIGELVSRNNLGLTVDATSINEVAGDLTKIIQNGISYSEDQLKRVAEENSLYSFLSTIDQAIR